MAKSLRRWWIVAILIVLALYAALVIYRVFALGVEEKTAEAVERIHGMSLTMDDVMGKNLPPRPGEAEAAANIEGIDVNENGIRDDVEVAIFDKYPNDAKTRAAALQYAKVEQSFLTDVFNEGTWKAVAEVSGRANICIADISGDYQSANALSEFIEALVLNTDSRKRVYEDSFRFITSHGSQNGTPCDIEI